MKVMLFEKVDKNYAVLKQVDLAAVPTNEDKIVVEISGTWYVFKIEEIQYSEDQKVEIMVTREKIITDHNKPNESEAYIYQHV